MVIKADIVDYMGKLEDGVLVLLSINCDGSFSEGTIFYSNENILLTIDQEIEDEIGSPIELWVGYKDLLISILDKLIPYDEISKRIDDLDFDKYIKTPTEFEYIDDDIDSDHIKLGTHSNI